ncbi:hypothetical protein CC86DRAFT_427623 [Ophiobolus disseminans]|uniref:Myb-like domain-containing protein n=1 Tax=Ophiobolus disseminans TaxID=1469910 RepID=A0A6A6ZID6_9PLEO|nr:hypothetical protein CC86DRAFT_427623 [Ophiobolus disseminans]
MAFSCSTSFVASPLSTKFVAYVPQASRPKPKPTPKAKSMAITKTAEHSCLGTNSQDSREWFYTNNDFTMLDSLPTDASHSISDSNTCSLIFISKQNLTSTELVDSFAGFCGASESENLEHDQFGGQSLDEGRPDQPLRVAEEDLAMIKLLRGTSRAVDLPLVVEGNEAEENYSGLRVEPSSVSDSQEGGQPMSTGNKEHITVQHSDLDIDKLRTFSIESPRHNNPLAQDEPLFSDVGVTDRPLATRKRTHPEVLDVVPELDLEDTRSTKRHKPVERWAESLTRIQVPTPRSPPLPVPSGGDSYSKASTEPSPGNLDHDSKRDGAGTPHSSASDLCVGNESSGSVHSLSMGKALLRSSRESIFRSEGIAGEQNFGSDSERRRENKEGSGGEFRGSHDELNQEDVLFPRSSAKLSQRRKRSNRLLEGKKHSLSRTTLRPRSSSTMPRASRQITPSQAQQLYWPVIDEEFQSCSPQTSSRGTKTGNELNINHKHSVDMAYQITDLTLCAVPNGSSIVTAVIRYRHSKWPLDPAVLGPKFLGRNSKVIRMTQLSPDSWMLLGYRCDNDAVVPCNRGSLDVERISNSNNDAAGHGTDHSDDDWDAEDEHGEQDIYRHSSRTHIAWPLSDEARLLSYKDNQGMEWKEIFKRFSDRTTGAVRTRYHKLRTEG